ncbi:MAG: cell division protein ZapA [Azovibrio sp.]
MTMGEDVSFLDVNILGREYRVACPPGEQAALQAAVSLVDDKMKGIALKSKPHTSERVAVMAALNIAHEYLKGAEGNGGVEKTFDYAGAKSRIKSMEARLDALLDQ